jgi:hypothetical protein
MSTFETPLGAEAREALLEISRDKSDGCHLAGCDPREVPLEILSRYHRAKIL